MPEWGSVLASNATSCESCLNEEFWVFLGDNRRRRHRLVLHALNSFFLLLPADGVDLSLLDHVSPVGWENVLLYGQYVLNRSLVKSQTSIVALFWFIRRSSLDKPKFI